jgi:hypothetical protein
VHPDRKITTPVTAGITLLNTFMCRHLNPLKKAAQITTGFRKVSRKGGYTLLVSFVTRVTNGAHAEMIKYTEKQRRADNFPPAHLLLFSIVKGCCAFFAAAAKPGEGVLDGRIAT